LISKFILSFTAFFITNVYCFSQTATIRGIILSETNTPIENVNITAGSIGTQTNKNGFYELKIPVNTDVKITFTHVSFKKITSTFNLKKGEELEFNPVMKTSVEQITTVVINSKKRKSVEGIITLQPETIRKIPGAQPGVENLLMTLPGVNNTKT